MARTALFANKRPGGAVVVADARDLPNAAIYVDSVNGSATNDGFTPDTAVTTLTLGVAAATAAKRDTIFLMPGHAESKTASGDIVDVSKSGLRVIGLGSQFDALIPTFTLGHASATFTVSAANVLLRGIKIIADAADVAIGVTLGTGADGCKIEDSWLTSGALTKELKIAINVATTCTDVAIRRCLFETVDSDETGSETHAVKLAGSADRFEMTDCVAIGNYGTAVLDGATAASVHVRILRNTLITTDTTNGLAISLHASTTGVVGLNLLGGSKTNTIPLASAGCWAFENYTTAAVNESGIIKPAVETFA